MVITSNQDSQPRLCSERTLRRALLQKSGPSLFPTILVTFWARIYSQSIHLAGVLKLSPLGPNFVANRPGKIDLKVFKSQIFP